jgi:hypothetical protein
MTATKRAPLPPLVVQHPLCPICDKEVRCDGRSFWCATCRGSWASHRYDVEGVADPDAEQCPAEVAPYEDGTYPGLVGLRYRCVRDAGHPADWPDRHIGVRSDGGVDHSPDPFEWRDGEYPQWQPAEEAPADA